MLSLFRFINAVILTKSDHVPLPLPLADRDPEDADGVKTRAASEDHTRRSPGALTPVLRVGLTIATIAVCAAIASIVQDVASVISFCSSIFSSTVAMAIPALLAFACPDVELPFRRVGPVVLILVSLTMWGNTIAGLL